MHAAVFGCCLLAAVAAPALSAAVPAWTEAVQREYEQVAAEARHQRWQSQPGAQPGGAELQLATLSAALLTRLKDQPDSWETVQRRLQLQEDATRMNLGKVELDGILSVDGELRQEKVYDALRQYLDLQKAMASGLGLESASQLWWSPFVTSSGDVRVTLQKLWTDAAPLVSRLLEHLRSLPAPAGRSLSDLLFDCAARDECADLVKLALPYPDVANVVSDLLRERKLTTEQVARLSEQFLGLLGLPAAPAQFWSSSEFRAPSADCASYADADRVRLCADADSQGLRSALSLMTVSEYLRTAAASQQPPFQTAPFPGFEGAVAECVSLLALQPSVVQQLVYGYRAEASAEARLAAVSLYLSRGGRSSGQADSRCHGDIGCQQSANALMEAAVTQLLPLAYHAASLRWLESLEKAPAADIAASWRSELSTVLGQPSADATPAHLDRHFYDAERHIARVLAGVAGFQLHAAACPQGPAECLPSGADAAGALLSRVMAAGSSQHWDQLLSETTELAPSARPLLVFFQPLFPESGEPTRPLRTLELEDDPPVKPAAGKAAQVHRLAQVTACDNVADKTPQEEALCLWNEHYDKFRRNMTDAEWAFGLDMNSTEKADEAVARKKDFLLRRNEARSALQGDPNDWIKDPTNADEGKLWGQMFILSEKDPGVANDETVQKLLKSTNDMLKAYVGVSVCPFDKQDCQDDEKMTIWDLRAAMAAGSMEEKELQYYWRQYRSAAKADLNTIFADYIARGREAASQAGLDHYGQFWLEPYGYGSKNETLLTELADTWEGLDPLYRSLHTVVRYQLHQAGLSSASGKQPLPSHLLGDMFAADWRNIYNDTKPFENYTIDIADKLLEKNYNIVKMRDDAVNYLKTLGLSDLSAGSCFAESVWSECQKGRDCDALAWTSGVDDCVAIRDTPEPTMDNYERVHAKSAELAYYLEYLSQDPEYRTAANPAFTEAVAGAVALSVLSPDNLKARGLLPVDEADIDGMYDVDFLYRRALQYLAPLPFNYVTNKWMWELFGNTLDRWEHRWWELREEIQGVRPSETRSDADTDMLGVPDLVRDRPGFQSYFSTVLQFQLFEKACVDDNQFDLDNMDAKPLYRCTLNKQAAANLKTLMGKGNSERWKTLLVQNTVNGTLSSESMVRYFAPLDKHLQSVIATNNLETHWESDLVEYWDEDVDNTVPIVVGVVLGVLVLIVVIAYFVSRARRNKEEE